MKSRTQTGHIISAKKNLGGLKKKKKRLEGHIPKILAVLELG